MGRRKDYELDYYQANKEKIKERSRNQIKEKKANLYKNLELDDLTAERYIKFLEDQLL